MRFWCPLWLGCEVSLVVLDFRLFSLGLWLLLALLNCFYCCFICPCFSLIGVQLPVWCVGSSQLTGCCSSFWQLRGISRQGAVVFAGPPFCDMAAPELRNMFQHVSLTSDDSETEPCGEQLPMELDDGLPAGLMDLSLLTPLSRPQLCCRGSRCQVWNPCPSDLWHDWTLGILCGVPSFAIFSNIVDTWLNILRYMLWLTPVTLQHTVPLSKGYRIGLLQRHGGTVDFKWWDPPMRKLNSSSSLRLSILDYILCTLRGLVPLSWLHWWLPCLTLTLSYWTVIASRLRSSKPSGKSLPAKHPLHRKQAYIRDPKVVYTQHRVNAETIGQ